MDASDLVLADHALVTALANGDARAAAAWLDDDFAWVDSDGRLLDKDQAVQALPKPPLGGETGLEPVGQFYGAVATIIVERDKVFVLRIWVKRGDAWRSHTNSAPSPLVSARLFGFPDAIVMACEHQPFHGKAARVSRVFVRRDGQWLMAVSFQTTRQDAAVKTI